MKPVTETAGPQADLKHLNVFERWLSLWVALCMVTGVAQGRIFPDATNTLRRLELADGSQINGPITVMLFVNWLVKPFSMAFLGWLLFEHHFLAWIGPEVWRKDSTRCRARSSSWVRASSAI